VAAASGRSARGHRWRFRRKPSQRWTLDFVSDALACGRRFRMLNAIDDYSRECLPCIVDTSL
jgi:putative transposase